MSGPGRVQTPYDGLTYRINGCAMAAHRQLGPGLREDTYHRALEARLEEAGLGFKSEEAIEVFDGAQNNVLVGYYIPDLVVADRVIVEIKTLNALDDMHLAQVISYLAVT